MDICKLKMCQKRSPFQGDLDKNTPHSNTWISIKYVIEFKSHHPNFEGDFVKRNSSKDC